jgi:uncharacterized protein involved in exopolysaccharide biosynthesis
MEDNAGNLPGMLMGTEINPFLGLGNFGGNSQLFAEMLKSRTAAEYVIEECGLINYFGIDQSADPLQEAAKELSGCYDVEVTKENIILLGVEFSTPWFSRFSATRDSVNRLSATVANTFVDALDDINRKRSNTKAQKTREYLEEQIEITKAGLDSVESRLKSFQLEYKTISLPEQVAAAIENAAAVRSEIIMTEIQIKTLDNNLQSDNKSLLALQNKLNALMEKYAELESNLNSRNDYFPKFEDVPEISFELAKLKRSVEIHNQVYLLLQQQYHTQKIQENKDIPSVHVLDKAIPSLRQKSPRLVYHTALSGIAAFILICSIIVLNESKIRKLRKGKL